MLSIGIFAGFGYNAMINEKTDINEIEEMKRVNNKSKGQGADYYLTNSKGDKISTVDQIDFNVNSLRININIDNYEKGKTLQYNGIVLIDSKQVEIGDDKKKSIDIIADKYGNNTFEIIIDDIEDKPKEIIVLLINKYEDRKSICFNISTKNFDKKGYEMQITDNEKIKRGIYLNSSYKKNNIESVDVVYNEAYKKISMPILFKNQEENKQFKIFIFNDYEQIKINDDDYIYLNCIDNKLKAGRIDIDDIKKGENNYILVAVPIGDNNYERYFSNRIKVIGE